MYNENLRAARHAYVDAALAEMNAVANVIENDDAEKAQIIMQQAQQLGETAQQKYWEFVEVARIVHPDNPALAILSFDLPAEPADEN
jgi:hypothetical protein